MISAKDASHRSQQAVAKNRAELLDKINDAICAAADAGFHRYELYVDSCSPEVREILKAEGFSVEYVDQFEDEVYIISWE